MDQVQEMFVTFKTSKHDDVLSIRKSCFFTTDIVAF